jgi:hypothetical protein
MIPGRLFEGLAAGAGLIGIPPDPAFQRRLLGRTVVEAVPTDPDDLPDFLDDALAGHDEHRAAANTRLALQGHDWAHRWRALFDHLGVTVPAGIEARIERLADRADRFA